MQIGEVLIKLLASLLPVGSIVYFATRNRHKLAARVSANETLAGGLAFIEAACALTFTGVIGFFGIYQPGNWNVSPPSFSIGLFLGSTTLGLYLSLKFGSTYSSRVERTEISSLRTQVGKFGEQAANLERQRNLLIQTLEILENLNRRRNKALSDVDFENEANLVVQVLQALQGSRDSAHLIAAAAHKVLLLDCPAGKKVRICIYFQHPEDRLQLVAAYSYDGVEFSCFDSEKKSPHHRLADAKNGTQSVVAKAYHTPSGTLHLYPDTHAAESQFTFWDESERALIKSALAYKHYGRFRDSEEAFVFYADSDEQEFFSFKRFEELKGFLAKICKLLEQEVFSNVAVEKAVLLAKKPDRNS